MQRLPLALAFGVLLAIGAPLASAATETVVKVDLNDDSIKFHQPSIHAGKTKFVVTNTSIYDNHEMVLVKAGDPSHPIEFDATQDRVVEAKLKSLGEVSDVKPGATAVLTATLQPGTYTLMCNMKGHYQHGMHAVLNVM
jgi:uncharacterized cupredoxin-like copper-binding protein